MVYFYWVGKFYTQFVCHGSIFLAIVTSSYKKTDRDINVQIRQHISGCLKNFAKNGVPNINQTHVQLKEVIINKLMKLDKVYKQTLFVRNSVTSNTNSLPSS